MVIAGKIKTLCYYLLIYPYHKMILKSLGGRTKIICPLKIHGASNISIGSRVNIEYKTWLAAVPLTNMPNCSLVIEDGTSIGHFNHIYATSRIHIGKKVLTADRVYITDNLHAYRDVTLAIMDQPIQQIQTVKIGDGSWLGENVCVIGANIGKGCVIGANSVVTKNIPDYCVAVGAPAKVIKRYNFEINEWLKTAPDGSFVDLSEGK